MIVKLALSLLLCFLCGFFVVSLLWPRRLATSGAIALQLCLAFGFGTGISSCWFLLWLCLAGGHDAFLATFAFPEFMITAGLGYLCYRRGIGPSKPDHNSRELADADWTSPLLAAILCAVLVCAIGSFVFIALRNPHGDFDAVSIWNLRARFLARGTTHWRDAFTDSLSIPHPDYPLLLPGTIARLWKYIGYQPVWAPLSAAFLFAFSSVGLICASLASLRNKQIGYLGGIVLLGVNSFIPLGASQYADTAVGLFILSALILVAIYDASPKRDHAALLVLAGAAAGFCAWTKNEGELFLLLFLMARFSFSLLRQGWRASAMETKAMLTGVLPVLAVLACFKLAVAPADYYLLAGTSTSGPMRYFLEPGTISQKLADASRYGLIAKTMAKEIARFGGRAIGITPFLALYVLLVGAYKKSIRAVESSILVLILLLAGYFAVYVTTPLNLAFQLQTSLSRLLLQLWPSAVFLFFMATSSNQSAESAEPVRSTTIRDVRSLSSSKLPAVRVS